MKKLLLLTLAVLSVLAAGYAVYRYCSVDRSPRFTEGTTLYGKWQRIDGYVYNDGEVRTHYGYREKGRVLQDFFIVNGQEIVLEKEINRDLSLESPPGQVTFYDANIQAVYTRKQSFWLGEYYDWDVLVDIRYFGMKRGQYPGMEVPD